MLVCPAFVCCSLDRKCLVPLANDTATNWDPVAPAASDNVMIGDGDTVNITGNLLPSSLNIILSGGAAVKT